MGCFSTSKWPFIVNWSFRFAGPVWASLGDKCATFFIHAAKFADEPISVHLMNRKAISPSTNTRRSAKQRKKQEETQQVENPTTEKRYHPFVQGLLDELPQIDQFESWSTEEQVTWLNTAASIFGLLSKQGQKITVQISTEKAN